MQQTINLAQLLKFIPLLFICLLFGCATPYASESLIGGYTETQLQPNVFSVGFRGNGYTSKQRASDFVMLRCAELTISNSFTYFVVLDSGAGKSTGYVNAPMGGGASLFMPIDYPNNSVSIACYTNKPTEPPLAYDADFLLKVVATKYGLIVENGRVKDPMQQSANKSTAGFRSGYGN